MTWKVVFSRRSQEQLLALHEYVAMEAGTPVAESYTDAIAEFCHSLTTFPQRGMRRDDLRPGLRVTNYRKRVVIAFAVDADIEEVAILSIFHGGQDYEAAMSGPEQ